jgi:hypothetical protein
MNKMESKNLTGLKEFVEGRYGVGISALLGVDNDSGLEVIHVGNIFTGQVISINPKCYSDCQTHNPALAETCSEVKDYHKSCPTFKRLYGGEN